MHINCKILYVISVDNSFKLSENLYFQTIRVAGIESSETIPLDVLSSVNTSHIEDSLEFKCLLERYKQVTNIAIVIYYFLLNKLLIYYLSNRRTNQQIIALPRLIPFYVGQGLHEAL